MLTLFKNNTKMCCCLTFKEYFLAIQEIFLPEWMNLMDFEHMNHEVLRIS